MVYGVENERNEEYSYTFIAMHKKFRLRDIVHNALSTEKKRQQLLDRAHRPSRQLNDLGQIGVPLDQVAVHLDQGVSRPNVTRPRVGAEFAFVRLPYIDAFVLYSSNPDGIEQARQLLEPDYLVIPNVELALSSPPIRNRLRRTGQRLTWPNESAIGEARRKGITGSGVLVGVLDTGCDADHLEFRQKRVDFRYVSPLDPTTNSMRPVQGFDVDGHGTHVCGVIAGRNVGVARDVTLMVASVINSESLKTNLDRVAVGLDWMLARFENRENISKPTIINMSLAFKLGSIAAPQVQNIMTAITDLLDDLVAVDVLVVGAIGNDGPGTVQVPACMPQVLSVGAVDWNLVVAPFSGGGVSSFTPDVQPDIIGYGVDVLSSLERDVDKDSWYTRISGTSMATPYVTGIAALLAAANPGLQGYGLRQRLISAALPLSGPRDRVGAGLARFVI